jgi:hypothetical protein
MGRGKRAPPTPFPPFHPTNPLSTIPIDLVGISHRPVQKDPLPPALQRFTPHPVGFFSPPRQAQVPPVGLGGQGPGRVWMDKWVFAILTIPLKTGSPPVACPAAPPPFSILRCPRKTDPLPPKPPHCPLPCPTPPCPPTPLCPSPLPTYPQPPPASLLGSQERDGACLTGVGLGGLSELSELLQRARPSCCCLAPGIDPLWVDSGWSGG